MTREFHKTLRDGVHSDERPPWQGVHVGRWMRPAEAALRALRRLTHFQHAWPSNESSATLYTDGSATLQQALTACGVVSATSTKSRRWAFAGLEQRTAPNAMRGIARSVHGRNRGGAVDVAGVGRRTSHASTHQLQFHATVAQRARVSAVDRLLVM